jgi:hypothetical protein
MSKKTSSDQQIKKTEEQIEFKETSLISNPFTTIKYLFLILSEQFIKFIKFLISNKIFLLLGLTYLILNFFSGPHLAVIITLT